MTILRQTTSQTSFIAAALCIAGLALTGGTGCRQKMADQPYYRPLEGSDVERDGRQDARAEPVGDAGDALRTPTAARAGRSSAAPSTARSTSRTTPSSPA